MWTQKRSRAQRERLPCSGECGWVEGIQTLLREGAVEHVAAVPILLDGQEGGTVRSNQLWCVPGNECWDRATGTKAFGQSSNVCLLQHKPAGFPHVFLSLSASLLPRPPLASCLLIHSPETSRLCPWLTARSLMGWGRGGVVQERSPVLTTPVPWAQRSCNRCAPTPPVPPDQYYQER